MRAGATWLKPGSTGQAQTEHTQNKTHAIQTDSRAGLSGLGAGLSGGPDYPGLRAGLSGSASTAGRSPEVRLNLLLHACPARITWVFRFLPPGRVKFWSDRNIYNVDLNDCTIHILCSLCSQEPRKASVTLEKIPTRICVNNFVHCHILFILYNS